MKTQRVLVWTARNNNFGLSMETENKRKNEERNEIYDKTGQTVSYVFVSGKHVNER